MSYDMVVANGTVVFEAGPAECHLGITGGKIAAIVDRSEQVPQSHELIDAKGRIVLPGGIEPHCHFWDPGEDYREGWESGTRARRGRRNDDGDRDAAGHAAHRG